MTDLISAPNAEDETPTDIIPPSDGTPPGGDQPLAWAPIEPTPKKKHLGMWIGIGAGVIVAGCAAASMILIAPGTTVNGISVGWLTPGAAAEAVSSHLADTEVTLTGVGKDIVVTGADLGADIDATKLADEAFAAHPMWNLGGWTDNAITGAITLDTAAAEGALRAAVPSTYVDAVDATVAFDEASSTYITTAAESGTGINLPDLTAAITAALADGGKSVEFPGGPTEAIAAITDDEAATTAETLNTLLTTIGFYVGEERTVPVAPAVAATWLSLDDTDGTLKIQADDAAIQEFVDTLPDLVNRAAVNAENIVDSEGTVLKELSSGANGRELGSTSGAAPEFAEQLETGNGVYELNVNETAFETVNLFRRIEVDLSQQRTLLYENETLVQSYPISSGKAGSPTDQGRFRIYAQLRSQNMGREDTTVSPFYYQPNVPYVSYFNADEAFHGAYWHNNFGRRMSHGCVNMPVDASKFLWEWATKGTEVWVHG